MLLDKADLVDAPTLARIEADLKGEVRAGVHFVRAENGRIDPDVLLGLSAAAEDDLEHRKSHHELEGEEEHDHDDFESFVVALGQQDDRESLLGRIAAAIRDHDILRLKGFIALQGADARLVVQAVGPRLSAYFDRPWTGDEERQSSLVVIGEKGLDAGAISAALAG